MSRKFSFSYNLDSLKPCIQILQFLSAPDSLSGVEATTCFISDKFHYAKGVISRDCLLDMKKKRTRKSIGTLAGAIVSILAGRLLIFGQLPRPDINFSKFSLASSFPQNHCITIYFYIELMNWIGGDGSPPHGCPRGLESDPKISRHIFSLVNTFFKCPDLKNSTPHLSFVCELASLPTKDCVDLGPPPPTFRSRDIIEAEILQKNKHNTDCDCLAVPVYKYPDNRADIDNSFFNSNVTAFPDIQFNLIKSDVNIHLFGKICSLGNFSNHLQDIIFTLTDDDLPQEHFSSSSDIISQWYITPLNPFQAGQFSKLIF